MQRRFRLRDSADFQRVRQEGSSWANRFLVLCALPNDLNHSRFGIVVSRNIGKAAVRNRAKRRIREAVRLRREMIATGWDLIFIARSPIREATFTDVERAVEQLLRRALLLSVYGDEDTVTSHLCL